MEPLVLELAKTIFAGVSAAAAAVQAWRRVRDAKQAAAAFDTTYVRTLSSAEAAAAATQLVATIPADVIKDLESRADRCWTSYRKVLGGRYLPDEIDNATDAVQACVCRELGRIHKLNGSIPERWQGQWDRYLCDERDEPQPHADPLAGPRHQIAQRSQEAHTEEQREMTS